MASPGARLSLTLQISFDVLAVDVDVQVTPAKHSVSTSFRRRQVKPKLTSKEVVGEEVENVTTVAEDESALTVCEGIVFFDGSQWQRERDVCGQED